MRNAINQLQGLWPFWIDPEQRLLLRAETENSTFAEGFCDESNSGMRVSTEVRDCFREGELRVLCRDVSGGGNQGFRQVL